MMLPNFVIKKNTSYMCIATDRLKYVDVTNFLAAGTSLRKSIPPRVFSVPMVYVIKEVKS